MAIWLPTTTRRTLVDADPGYPPVRANPVILADRLLSLIAS
jgi:hypothetical protein